MQLEHAAIWTEDLEKMKDYYTGYFEATAGAMYTNPKTQFQSYFLSFDGGARLEIMHRPGIPQNQNDRIGDQHIGLIHLAFALDNEKQVDDKAMELKAAGFSILRGPRWTGDGYYEFETADPDGNRLEVTFTQSK
jgi:lactoylglutathione lyase